VSHNINECNVDSNQQQNRFGGRNIDFHLGFQFDIVKKEEGCSNSAAQPMAESKSE
jgi:hypothetical protein